MVPADLSCPPNSPCWCSPSSSEVVREVLPIVVVVKVALADEDAEIVAELLLLPEAEAEAEAYAVAVSLLIWAVVAVDELASRRRRAETIATASSPLLPVPPLG